MRACSSWPRPCSRSSSASGIVVALVGKAWSFFAEVDKSTLWGDNWAPRSEQFSHQGAARRAPCIVTGIAMLIAVPLGLGSAIYLSEYASPRVRRTLKPILEILAGIPSVVLGFFCVSFISPEHRADALRLGRHVQPRSPPASASASSPIPLVASVSEDAMRSVPLALREASYGLGARKITTVPAGGRARRRLRPGGRVHPRRLPGHRRDDGRAPRRRVGERARSSPQPARGGPHDDRRHRLADPRAPTPAVSRPRRQQPLLRRARALPHHPRPQRGRRPVRPPGAAGATEHAMARHHPRHRAADGRRAGPARAHQRRRATSAGRVFQARCSLCPAHRPRHPRRPPRRRVGRRVGRSSPTDLGDFLTGQYVVPRRRRPASTTPCGARSGSACSPCCRSRSGSPPPSTSRSTPRGAASRTSSTSTSATSPACRRSCTASSGSTILVETSRASPAARTLISAGITIAVLVLPIVIITSAEAMRAVPEQPPGGRASGSAPPAGRSSAARSSRTPRPGILTGTVLALARALGEAAPLLLVGAVGERLVGRLRRSSTSPSSGQPFTALPDRHHRLGQAAARLRVLRAVGRRHRRDAGDRAHRQLGRHPAPQPLREEESG